MVFSFDKYQGTGNDFVMIDNRDLSIRRDASEWVSGICHRRFGVGADGLILLQPHPEGDFEMVYFNADGKEGTMCGNGGRCVIAFAEACGIVKDRYRFLAADGWHEGYMDGEDVALLMGDVANVHAVDGAWQTDTGSPHYVQFTNGVAELDVHNLGRTIRHNEMYREKGINVNFAEHKEGGLFVRTFERGVEAETFSCGTGVTAVALADAMERALPDGQHMVTVHTPGGVLEVAFTRKGDSFTDIWLKGPAMFVFSGLAQGPA